MNNLSQYFTIVTPYLQVYLTTSGKDEPEVIEVRIWSDAVANLTLMALGSSAPEILLSCFEIVGRERLELFI